MEDNTTEQTEELGGEMSFLDHLDELRKRLVNSTIILVIAFGICWFASGEIYNFLSIPVRRALSEAQRREVSVEKGLTGNEKIVPITDLKEGDTVRYVFDKATKIGVTVLSPGTTVQTIVAKDGEGNPGFFTNEPLIIGAAIIPKGVRLPGDFTIKELKEPSADENLIVTTLGGSFSLYVTVSLYAAIALSIPLLLWQIWGFISPALYKHERAYVTPFIVLSSVSFVAGAAFAYYILFPPAARYLLGLGEDFRLLLSANDYFDFITLIMLAMGIIFQMPAVTYVLARIGIVSASFLVKIWKVALVVILIVAAVVSPTGDIPNMMLFAMPMIVLYIISIFIAWMFGKKRVIGDAAENI